MSLESEIESVLAASGVRRVEFEEGSGSVQVLYGSHEFFKAWPHGSDVGSHDQLEEYFRDRLGVDWSLVELVEVPRRGGDDAQVAVFDR